MTTFEEFLKEKQYLQDVSHHTLAFYRQSFKAFNLQEPVTQSQLNERVAQLRQAGKSAACVDAYIRGINPFLAWLNENQFVKEPLRVKRLKLPKRVCRTFSEPELRAIIFFKPPASLRRIHTLVLLALDTGCRIDELLTLQRSKVDFDNLLISVRGKANKER